MNSMIVMLILRFNISGGKIDNDIFQKLNRIEFFARLVFRNLQSRQYI
jgi:hypothetical protein